MSGSFDRRLLVWRVDPTTTKLSIAGKLFDRKDMSMKSTIDLSSSHDSEQSPVAAHDDALAHNGAITALVTFCCVTGTYPNGTSTACVASTAEDLKIKIGCAVQRSASPIGQCPLYRVYRQKDSPSLTSVESRDSSCFVVCLCHCGKTKVRLMKCWFAEGASVRG